MNKLIKTSLLVLPALLIYAYFCDELNFTQDDAYISYRYVANYLGGDGLVYNAGQYVEGFTNFGWVIFLALVGALGAPFILVSKLTGFVFGGGVVVLTFLTARHVLKTAPVMLAMLASLLVAFNQALAYWSPAGLETAAFTFFAFLSLYLYFKRSWLTVAGLVLSTLLRPEGALIVGILIVIESIERRQLPTFTIKCAALAFVFLLPMVVFKLAYYGSVIPNPFYAKAGFGPGKISEGLQYSAGFFEQVGFYGLGLLIPIFYYRKLSDSARAALAFTVLFCVYVVLIGGDVLKVHRFFMPVFGTVAVLVVVSIWLMIEKYNPKLRHLILFVAAVGLLSLTYWLPRETVLTYNSLEKAITKKMNFIGYEMRTTDPSDFSVATPTIGALGYELLGHEIIDMVGLTDTTIARHSEEPVEGMKSTWKEEKHNSRYLLARAPDYILFSTGVKPSAPAEKALLLYPQFLQSYRTVGWALQPDPLRPEAIIQSAFKKMRPIEGDIVPTYPIEFVENYKLGLDAYSGGDQKTAIKYFSAAIVASPDPAYIYLYYHEALSYLAMRQHPVAAFLMDSVLIRDSLVYMAHAQLYKYAAEDGNTKKASIHRRWLLELTPWYLPRIEAQIAERHRKKQSNRR